MAGNFRDIPHIKKRQFLNAFAECGQVTLAATIAKCDRNNHYHWLKDDPEYAEAFKEAQEMAGDVLEAEAIRRGLEKSDVLLIFTLKGARPGKYRDNVDITSGGKSIAKGYAGVSPDDWPDGKTSS